MGKNARYHPIRRGISDPEALRAALQAWLGRRLGGTAANRIVSFWPAASGASNETVLFDLESNGETLPMVLRTAAQNGRGLFPHYDLSLQARVMMALAPTGVPVPTVRFLEEDPGALGSPFFIMDRLPGRTPSDDRPGLHGSGILFEASREERGLLWWRSLEPMLDLHRLDWRTLDLPPLPGAAADLAESMRGHVAMFRTWLDWASYPIVPTVQRGLVWLAESIAPEGNLALTWGDGRPGNILYDAGRVVALLDWELAAIGVPEADIGYFIWSAEVLAEVNGLERLDGLPTRDETWEWYARATGASDARIRFGETFALLRLCVMAALGLRASGSEDTTYLHENRIVRRLASILDA